MHLHDPLLPSEPLDEALRDADFVFLAMNHDAFEHADARRACARSPARTRSSATSGTCCGTGRIVFSAGATERPGHAACCLSHRRPRLPRRRGGARDARRAGAARARGRTRSWSCTTRPTIRRCRWSTTLRAAPSADPRRAQPARSRPGAGAARRLRRGARRGGAGDDGGRLRRSGRLRAACSRELEAGYDLVAASRYMPGGRQLGGPPLKGFLSRTAGVLAALADRPADARSDQRVQALPTRDARAPAPRERRRASSSALEITVKAFLAGYRITEVPTTWRDRDRGPVELQAAALAAALPALVRAGAAQGTAAWTRQRCTRIALTPPSAPPRRACGRCCARDFFQR